EPQPEAARVFRLRATRIDLQERIEDVLQLARRDHGAFVVHAQHYSIGLATYDDLDREVLHSVLVGVADQIGQRLPDPPLVPLSAELAGCFEFDDAVRMKRG